MDWTSADLTAFNIVVQDQDQDTFFDGPLPDYSGFPGFIEKEEVVISREVLDYSQLVSNVERVREDMDASPIEAEWSFTLFLESLLRFMGYQYVKTHPAWKVWVTAHHTVRMVVRNEFAVTIVNVIFEHVYGDTVPFPKLKMLILQHNKSPIKVSDPEAHLIVTAIGAFQENKNSARFWTELEEQVVFGVTTAEQIIPTFYKIKVTSELERAVRLGEKPVTQTVVWRHKARMPKPYDDIMRLENRRRVALYLEGLKKLLLAQCHVLYCPNSYCKECSTV